MTHWYSLVSWMSTLTLSSWITLLCTCVLCVCVCVCVCVCAVYNELKSNRLEAIVLRSSCTQNKTNLYGTRTCISNNKGDDNHDIANYCLPVVLHCLHHLHPHFPLDLRVPLVTLWGPAFLALPCCQTHQPGQEHLEYRTGPGERQLLVTYAYTDLSLLIISYTCCYRFAQPEEQTVCYISAC